MICSVVAGSIFIFRLLPRPSFAHPETEKQMDGRLGDWARKHWDEPALTPAERPDVEKTNEGQS